MRLIIGLGNPGREYQGTRHNVGFLVLDELARRLGASGDRRAHRAVLTDVVVGGQKVLLAKPQTYMNLSGQSVAEIVRYYKIETGELLVVYDDLDLAFGRIRIRPGGSGGGHNGVRSLIQALGTQEIPRLRVGIGRPSGGRAIGHVLSRWTSEEREALGRVVGDATDAVESILEKGLLGAMNEFNGR